MSITTLPWSLQDAKAQFSQVVDNALRGRAQHVTRHGKPAVVVLAEQEYTALQRSAKALAPGFVAHLLSMPKPSASKAPTPQAKTKTTQRAQLALRDIDFT